MSSNKFEFDEDTYTISFTFSGYDKKDYKIVINANYQNDDYIELYEVDENVVEHLIQKYTDDGMDSMWEHLYLKHTQPILVQICDLVRAFMEARKTAGE